MSQGVKGERALVSRRTQKSILRKGAKWGGHNLREQESQGGSWLPSKLLSRHIPAPHPPTAKRNPHEELTLSDEGSQARTAKVKRGAEPGTERRGLVERHMDLGSRERRLSE